MKRAAPVDHFPSKLPRVGGSSSQAIADKIGEMTALGLIGQGELDPRVITELEMLPEETALACLDSLAAADLARISNKSGFLKGIINPWKVRLANQNSTGQMMHPSVQAKLDLLYSSGQLHPGDIDSSILESLAGFDPVTGQSIVDALAAKDLSNISNKSGFLAGIMKRYRMVARSPSQTAVAQRFGNALDIPTVLQAAGVPVQTANAVAAILPLLQGGGLASPVPMRQPTGPLHPLVRGRLTNMENMGLLAPGEIDQRILDSLSQFPPQVGLQVLDKFAETDVASIANKNGFLAGIMRRFRGGVPTDPAKSQQAVSHLPPRVQLRIEQLYQSGVVGRHELDAKALEQLQYVDEAAALDALERFAAADVSNVNNKSGFLVGIIKRGRQIAAAATPAAPQWQQSAYPIAQSSWGAPTAYPAYGGYGGY